MNNKSDDVTLFASWRSIWQRNADLQPLLNELDALTALRMAGNKILPSIPKNLNRTHIKQTYDEMESANKATTAISEEQVRRWMAALSPVLEVERWGRWLYLERALQISSLSGDLLFSALLLRSMGEETLRLLVLDFKYDRKEIKFNNKDSACRAWVSGALIAIEPLVQLIESAIAPHTPKHFSKALGEKGATPLKEVIKALNDYVHPNFGSHVLGCFPEESKGIHIILKASIAIYSAFLSMEWTREPLLVDGGSIHEPYLAPIQTLCWRIENRIIKPAQKILSNGRNSNAFDAPNFINWLRKGEEFNENERYALVESDFLDNLQPLLPVDSDDASENTTAALLKAVNASKFPIKYRSGTVLRSWSIARRADYFLTEQRSTFRGEPSIGSTEWLQFNAYALHLSISVSLLKIEMLVGQAAFQVASNNPLGAAFCARALLEAVASIDWLIGSLESSWQIIVDSVRQGNLSEDALSRIDADLAKFLTGTRQTFELGREWGGDWSVSGIENLGMLHIADTSFRQQPEIRKIYDITSAMVHGRLMRGVEVLFTNTVSKYFMTNIVRGLTAADYLCDPDVQMFLRSRAFIMSKRLMSLADAIGKGENSLEMIERATLAMDSLEVGKHYSGTGKINDPIKFVEGLPYNEAFHRYCTQFAIDAHGRKLLQTDGIFMDSVLTKDGLIYFVPPQDENS